MADFTIRRATAEDVPFLVEAICEAEKGGSDRLSYCGVFSMNEPEFRAALVAMLNEDLAGQELCISGFLVADVGDGPIAACCAWVEAAGGTPSTLLKANLLLHGIDRARMREARRWFARLAELSIPREPGAIQIESVYVRADGRGRGLAARLIELHLEQLGAFAPAQKAQVILAVNNPAARAAYARAGFAPALDRWSTDESLLEVVPSLGKLLMEKTLMGEH